MDQARKRQKKEDEDKYKQAQNQQKKCEAIFSSFQTIQAHLAQLFVPHGVCTEDVKLVPIIWWHKDDIYIYSLHDVGKPMTGDIKPEKVMGRNMGDASQTWADHFAEAKDEDMNDFK